MFVGGMALLGLFISGYIGLSSTGEHTMLRLRADAAVDDVLIPADIHRCGQDVAVRPNAADRMLHSCQDHNSDRRQSRQAPSDAPCFSPRNIIARCLPVAFVSDIRSMASRHQAVFNASFPVRAGPAVN